MIMQPDHITAEMYQEALAQLWEKKPNPALDKMRFETFHEGLSMQIMHIGPYSEEPATLAKMDAFARENGYTLRGKHHEIYLGEDLESFCWFCRATWRKRGWLSCSARRGSSLA